MSRAAVGSAPAGYEALVAQNERAVLRIARAVLRDEHLGADAAQEAFVRLWRRMGESGGLEHPEAWLRRAAVSSPLDLARRREVRTRGEARAVRSEERATAHAAHPLARATEAELRERLERALAELPEGQRTVFALRHEGGHVLGQPDCRGDGMSPHQTRFAGQQP